MTKEKNRKEIEKWLHEKSKLNDWFHYYIEIKVLDYDVSSNFVLRDFEVKIQRQTKDLCMQNFKTLILKQWSFNSILKELIQKLKMYSGYVRLNNSPIYDLRVYDFYNNTLEWVNHIEKINGKYDEKEHKYRMEVSAE